MNPKYNNINNHCAMVAKVGISIAQGCTIEAAWQSKLFYRSQNMFGIDDASVSWK